MLHLSDQNSTSFLEDGLIIPGWVESGQLGGEQIVLAHPDGVQHGQVGLLVDASVAWGNETRFGLHVPWLRAIISILTEIS